MRSHSIMSGVVMLLLLVINSSRQGDVPMDTFRTGEHRVLVPALLALHALRAALGVSIPPDQVVIASGTGVLDDHQAALYLTHMSPSFCSAIHESGTLVVDCREMDEPEQEHQQKYFQRTNGWLGEAAREALGESDRHAILVVGGGPSIMVNVEELDAAARKFFIDVDGFVVNGRYAKEEERRSGIAWVVGFSGRRPY